MVGFTWIDFAILVVYLLAVLFAGLLFSKGNEGKRVLQR